MDKHLEYTPALNHFSPKTKENKKGPCHTIIIKGIIANMNSFFNNSMDNSFILSAFFFPHLAASAQNTSCTDFPIIPTGRKVTLMASPNNPTSFDPYNAEIKITDIWLLTDNKSNPGKEYIGNSLYLPAIFKILYFFTYFNNPFISLKDEYPNVIIPLILFKFLPANFPI